MEESEFFTSRRRPLFAVAHAAPGDDLVPPVRNPRRHGGQPHLLPARELLPVGRHGHPALTLAPPPAAAAQPPVDRLALGAHLVMAACRGKVATGHGIVGREALLADEWPGGLPGRDFAGE